MQTERPYAYSYVRMSTNIQLKGDSLRRQKDASQRYAELNNLKLIDDFKLEDIGVSAFTGANVETGCLGVFLEHVKTNKIPKGSFLLVESLDRLSRQDLLESVPLFLSIIRAGINIVTLIDQRLYPAGEAKFEELLFSIITLSRAHEESKTKSMRVSAAWNNKRANLDTQKLTKICPAWLELSEDRKSYKVVLNHDQTIKLIFSEADAGHGSFSIASKLNREGIPTLGKSNGWHQSYVSKILANRAVIGEFQPHRYVNGEPVASGEPISNYFPVLVSEDQFLRVQAGRRSRQVIGAGRKGPENRNLFTHIAKCEYCGSPMRFVNKGSGPKGGYYLKCTNAVRKFGCVTTGWKYADFETSFLYFVKEIDLAATLRNVEQKSDRSIVEAKLDATNERIRELEQKREQTYELVGSMASDFLRSKLEECESQIQVQMNTKWEIETQIAQLRDIKEFDENEVKQQILELQLSGTHQIAEKRMAVAQKLRSMVTALTVAPEGDKPKLAKIDEFLRQAQTEETERKRILTYIDEAQQEFGRTNRSFTVTLADGIARKVIIESNDPTKFITQVTVQPDEWTSEKLDWGA